MPWKRCEGCTRAISTQALTCEYCGRACDALDGLPAEGTDPDYLAAWPSAGPQPVSTTSELPQGLPPLELNTSFPFTEVDGAPLHEEPSAPAYPAEAGQYFLDEDLNDDPAVVTPAGAASASAPNTAGPAPVAEPAVKAAASATKKSVGSRQMVMLGGALIAASALIFTILSMRPSASPDPVAPTGTPAPARKAAANRTPSGAARSAGAPASAAAAPKWTHVTSGRWTGGDKKSVAFELQATNRIHIWTRDVTPLLIVRCQGGQVEPFVYTQSAARMEPQDGDHTVRVAFDEGPEVTERWPDSDEHDALFAKDAAGFTHQLVAAETLRFGFEPHNAPPASIHFDVSGIGELLAASPKQCGKR